MPYRKTKRIKADVQVNGVTAPSADLWIVLPDVDYTTAGKWLPLHPTEESATAEALRMVERFNISVRVGVLDRQFKNQVVCVK